VVKFFALSGTSGVFVQMETVEGKLAPKFLV